MTDGAGPGHDGPYPAPVQTRPMTVPADWIDYNGHMNVGFYGVAFDRSLDQLLDLLGLGEDLVRTRAQGPYVIQTHLNFLRELRQGAQFFCRFRLLDHDHKRMHYFARMYDAADQAPCATQEGLIMNVSHDTGRSAPYPDRAMARLARMLDDHRNLPADPIIGATLGIRRA